MIESNIWKPTKCVGGIMFGFEEANLSAYDLFRMPEEETSANWNVYGNNGDSIRVYCENDRVISIAVYECLYFDGLNLIGSSIEKVQSLFSENHFISESPFEMTDGLQTPWSCDALGIMLWVNTKGIVVSCSCDDGK